MAKRIFAPAVAAFSVLALLIGIFAAPMAAHSHEAAPGVPHHAKVSVVPGDGGVEDTSEEPAERLPSTGEPLATLWMAGAAALMTGAVVAVAILGRRRMLRGAAYW